MRTAVSIPDDVFNEAEELAKRSRISRSELYADGLRALLREDRGVTEALDGIYRNVPSDHVVNAVARRTVSRSEW